MKSITQCVLVTNYFLFRFTPLADRPSISANPTNRSISFHGYRSGEHYLKRNHSNNNSYKQNETTSKKHFYPSHPKSAIPENKICKDGATRYSRDRNNFSQLNNSLMESRVKFEDIGISGNQSRLVSSYSGSSGSENAILSSERPLLLQDFSPHSGFPTGSNVSENIGLHEKTGMDNEISAPSFAKTPLSNFYSDAMHSLCGTALTFNPINYCYTQSSHEANFSTFNKPLNRYPSKHEEELLQHQSFGNSFYGEFVPQLPGEKPSLQFDSNPRPSLRGAYFENLEPHQQMISSSPNFLSEYAMSQHCVKAEIDENFCSSSMPGLTQNSEMTSVSDKIGKPTYLSCSKQSSSCFQNFSDCTGAAAQYTSDSDLVNKEKDEVCSDVTEVGNNTVCKVNQLSASFRLPDKTASCFSSTSSDTLTAAHLHSDSSCLQSSVDIATNIAVPVHGSFRETQETPESQGSVSPSSSHYLNFSKLPITTSPRNLDATKHPDCSSSLSDGSNCELHRIRGEGRDQIA